MSQGMSSGIEAEIKKQATTALITGILGLVCCAPLAIWAYIAGSSAERMIAQHGVGQEHQTLAKAGRILAIVTAVLLVLGIVLQVVVLIVGGLAATVQQ
jgi:hypothetical protein